MKQEPDFQFDDADVAKSWSKLQLDLVDEIPPPMVAQEIGLWVWLVWVLAHYS